MPDPAQTLYACIAPLDDALAHLHVLARAHQQDPNNPEMSKLACQALMQATSVEDPAVRLQVVEAILNACHITIARQTISDVVMGHFIEQNPGECIPALHRAGFSLRAGDDMDNALVIIAIGEGRWPHPELTLPDLCQCEELNELVLAIDFDPRDEEVASHVLENLARLGTLACAHDIGPALTQSLLAALPGQGGALAALRDLDYTTRVVAALVRLGADTAPVMAQLSDASGKYDAIIDALSEATRRGLAHDTPLAQAPARRHCL